ncbi:extracellular solute-binding protein [Cohnella sp. GCM10020058]|uniref:extracellular solute-binding protein n=1 Tax=Cohnella sp. GCM10020058 TaxID=3317330 RepID=UPI003642BE28
MAKYDPGIEVSMVRAQDSSTKFKDGESFENNIWSKTYLDTLGIKINYKWIVPEEQYEQKLNLSIASGDIPDIIPARAKQFKDLVENDMVLDLTDLYEKYATPLTKEIMNQDPIAFNTGKIDGKLMALPNTSSSIDTSNLLFVRSDWLTKLGLPEPKTMQDVLAISEAFTKQDPDGNGKNDTIGMALTKSFINDGFAGAQGFFNGYHAYPGVWVKDASGQVVYGSIQPEIKTALKQLQDMYSAGQIDAEFGVKDGSKVAETAASGKVGIEFGAMWNPVWPLQQTIDNDPKAEWKAYQLASIDDKPALAAVHMPVTEYFVINKDAKNPEAAIKMLNLFVEKMWGKTADAAYLETEDIHKYATVQAWPARQNLDAYLHVMDAIETKDTSKMNAEEKVYYDNVVAFNNGDLTKWNHARIYGSRENSTFSVINQYVENNLTLYEAFYGAPTPTMSERRATLDKMELEVFTKIIMGQSIDTFDKFVADWKKLGGDQITKEVNDWAAASK